MCRVVQPSPNPILKHFYHPQKYPSCPFMVILWRNFVLSMTWLQQLFCPSLRERALQKSDWLAAREQDKKASLCLKPERGVQDSGQGTGFRRRPLREASGEGPGRSWPPVGRRRKHSTVWAELTSCALGCNFPSLSLKENQITNCYKILLFCYMIQFTQCFIRIIQFSKTLQSKALCKE